MQKVRKILLTTYHAIRQQCILYKLDSDAPEFIIKCTVTVIKPWQGYGRLRGYGDLGVMAGAYHGACHHPQSPRNKPFVWTADPERVLAAVKRGKQALESVH